MTEVWLVRWGESGVVREVEGLPGLTSLLVSLGVTEIRRWDRTAFEARSRVFRLVVEARKTDGHGLADAEMDEINGVLAG